MSFKMYVRGPDGFIFEFSPVLAAQPGCVVLTEMEAFPEKFERARTVIEAAPSNNRRGRKPKAVEAEPAEAEGESPLGIDLSVDDFE